MFVTQPFTTTTRSIQHPPGLKIPPDNTPSKSSSSFADQKRTSYGLIIFSRHRSCNCIPLHDGQDRLVSDEQIACHGTNTRECQVKLILVENRASYGFVDIVRHIFAHVQQGVPLRQDILFRHLSECSSDEQELLRQNTGKIDVLYKACFNRTISLTSHQKTMCPAVKRALDSVLSFIPLRSGNRYNDIGFPKGHKLSANESSLDCAKRETFEETGIRSDMYDIVHAANGTPLTFSENFVGSDGNKYTHIYFLARLTNDDTSKVRTVLRKAKKKRNCEIKSIYYVNIQQAYSLIRSTNYTKLNIVRRVFNAVVQKT